MKKGLKVIIIMLLISLMLISNYFIFKELKQSEEQEKIFENLTNIVEENNKAEENKEIYNESNFGENKNLCLEELYKINNDLIGWLKIDNTSINYPVMQSLENPNYYLKRNFYKSYSSYGTPYLAENCSINNSDNLVIYGHHIKNSKMFGELEKYKNEKFYKNHKEINFSTLNCSKKYEIFSVVKTTAYIESGFKYYEYTNLKNENRFNIFLNQIKINSIYEVENIPNYGDKILTLSTCEYSNENGRLVIFAKEI